MTDRSIPESVDAYIAACPPDVQPILRQIRSIVKDEAPQAKEKISYRMPAFTLDGDLLYFAAFKTHIGIYPPVQGDARLAKQMSPYKGEKGNLRFPLDQPMPYDLIRRIVQRRIKEHQERLASKRGKR